MSNEIIKRLGSSTQNLEYLTNGTDGDLLSIMNGVPVWFDTKIIYCVQANIATTLGTTIDSTKLYYIAGVIDLGTTEIAVPSGGINISGSDFDISGLMSTENNYTMFTSTDSGNVLMKNIFLKATGTSSKIYDLIDTTGLNAIELERVNYNDCTSLGTLDGFRQGLETGTGRFGGSPSLILKGAWLGGFRITTSIVRVLSAGMTGALFQEGTSFVMQSRFLTDMNCDLPASASLLDFVPANFPNPSTLQIQGAIITRNGVSDPSDSNLTPNITPSDLSSSWKNNQGLGNTFEGGTITTTSEVATTVVADSTFYTLAGTVSATDLQHFDSPSSGQLRHLGDTPREYLIIADMVLESNSNNEVDLRVKKWDDSASSFVTVFDQSRQINNLLGVRNVGFYNINISVTLDKDDYIFFEVANNTASNDITAEVSSFFSVRAR